ncbi:hypothetical protein BT69DRAFT_1094261 [Atractiella rhizophila]|nr:hypothetical protein BT69DRAFT_1094261 [Atractiella rhizophila]
MLSARINLILCPLLLLYAHCADLVELLQLTDFRLCNPHLACLDSPFALPPARPIIKLIVIGCLLALNLNSWCHYLLAHALRTSGSPIARSRHFMNAFGSTPEHENRWLRANSFQLQKSRVAVIPLSE